MRHPMPDWLKVRIRLRPDQLRQFRKFLKLIHKIEKRQAAKRELELSVTPSCGCVFCDIDLQPVNGFHEGPQGQKIECQL